MENSLTIYTIGHSNVPASKLISLLKQHGIQVLVDVRSSPYSQYVPQFNREDLQAVLQREGLDYKYAGDYLGGRPKDPTCYKNSQIPDGHADFLHLVDYPAVMTKEWYQKGIDRLVEITLQARTAIMCSEENPERCHRQHLISQTLLQKGIEVLHIRGDGQLQKAWLIEAKDDMPAEQIDFFGAFQQEIPASADPTEPELIYGPFDDGTQHFSFPDFLADGDSPSAQKKAGKKSNKKPPKKMEEQAQVEWERIQKWIESNKPK